MIENFDIEKFNGRDFLPWKLRMKAILRKDGCLAAISERSADIIDDNVWNEMDEKAMANLHLALADEVLLSIEEKKTAKEIWDHFTRLYEVTSTRKFDDESTVKAREVHAVVSALVATAAFAAAFTLPGGYKNDKDDKDLGSAILSHEQAFVSFVIADSVAMISASLAMSFFYFSAFAEAVGIGTNYKRLTYKLMVLYGLLGQVALVVAFVTGLYAVLKSALTLAIATFIIVLFFIIAHYF